MLEEFKESFMNLDIEDKRAQISKELVYIGELIKTILQEKGIDSKLSLESYIPSLESDISNDEYLLSIFENVYSIKNEMIMLANADAFVD